MQTHTLGPRTTGAGSRIRFVAVTDDTCRVVDPGGRIVGHVQLRPVPGGTRVRAKRFNAAAGGFVLVGEFWSVDEAIAALRS